MDALLLAKNVWKKKYGDGTRGEEEFGRGRNQKVYDDFFFKVSSKNFFEQIWYGGDCVGLYVF